MRTWPLVFAALAAASPAHAERRPGLTGGVVGGGGQVTAAGARGPGFSMGAYLGWLAAATGARLGVEAELFGGQAWLAGGHRVDGVLVGAVRAWPHDRVALTVGLGVTAGDTHGVDAFVAGGTAIAGSLSVDLRRWDRTAFAARLYAFGGSVDGTTAYTLSLGLALDFYALSSPPR